MIQKKHEMGVWAHSPPLFVARIKMQWHKLDIMLEKFMALIEWLGSNMYFQEVNALRLAGLQIHFNWLNELTTIIKKNDTPG